MGFRLPSTTSPTQNNVSETPEPIPNLTVENIVEQQNNLPGPVGKSAQVPNQLNYQSPVERPDIQINKVEQSEILKTVGIDNGPLQADSAGLTPDERQSAVESAIGTRTTRDPLYPPRVRARQFEEAQIKNMNEIAEKLKVTPEEAQTLLIQTPKNELTAYPELQDMDKRYPGIVSWAQRPENFKIMLKDPRAVIKVEESNEGLSMSRDLGRVLTQNYYSLQLAAIHSMVATGSLDIERGTNLLSQLQDQVENNSIKDYAPQAERIGKSFDELKSQLNMNFNDLKKSLITFYGNHKLFSPTNEWRLLKQIYRTTTGSTKGVAKFLATAIDEPEAFTLLTLQSLYSTAPSIGALAAGTYVGGPLVGAAAAGGTAMITSFAQYFAQEQDKFRDPNTGKIDFKAMYSDAEVLENMRIQAGKYATTHAVMEYIGGRVLNANLAGALSSASKASSVVSKVATVAKGVTKAVAEEAAQEFAGETAAQLVTGATPGEAVSEGVFEGLAGGLMGVGSAGLQLGVLGLRTPKIEQIVDIQRQLNNINDKALKAQEDFELVKQSKDAMSEAGLKDFKPQMQELIQNNTTLRETNTQGVIEERDAFVTIVHNQLTDLAESLNQDPMDIINQLGDSARQAYMESLTKGQKSFDISLAEYQVNSLDIPELDSIIYINGNEFNASESNEFRLGVDNLQTSLDELVDKADQEITFRADETGEIPPMIPGVNLEEGQQIPAPQLTMEGATEVNKLGEDIDTVVRPIDLIRIGMSEAEQEVFDQLRRDIQRVTKEAPAIAGITSEVSDMAAKVYLDNLKMRAAVTGRDIKALASESANFRFSSKSDSSKYTTGYAPTGERKAYFTFNKSATPATIIHEFGHAWLDNMANDWNFVSNLQDRNQLQEEYFQAMETMAELFNIPDMSHLLNKKLSPAEVTTIHESFAKTTERYFLEGKSDSPRLKRALDFFRRTFAQFISSIMMRYPGIPSLEINQKTSRVFETILNATNVANETVYPLFPAPMFTPELLGAGAQAEQYRKALAESRSEALAQMYSKVMNRNIKEREALIDSALDSFYTRAKDDVSTSPSMLFKNIIQQGPAENRITYDSIKAVLAGGDDVLTKNIIKETAPKIVAGQKKAGIDVRQYMNQLGITSKEEMVLFLAETSNEQGLIDARMQELIDEEWPAFKTDAELHQAAVESVNNEGKRKMLKAELKVLAENFLTQMQKMSGIVAKPAAAINAALISEDIPNNLKTKGERFVLDSLAMRMRPNDFEKLQNKFGRLAATELAKGNYERAFEYKQQEAEYYFATKIAMDSKRKVDSTIKKITRYDSTNLMTIGRDLDVDYISYIKAISGALKNGIQLPNYNETNFKYNSLDESQIQVVNTIINTLNKNIAEFNTTENLTVEHILMLGQAVNVINKQARDIIFTLKNERKENIQTVVSGIVNEMATFANEKGKKVSLDESFLQGLSSEFPSMLNFMAGLYPDEKAFARSVLYQEFAKVAEAEAVKTLHKNEDISKIVDAAKEMVKNDPEIQSIMKGIKNRFIMLKNGVVGKPIAAPELGNYTFQNKGELLQFLLYMGSESGRRVLYTGGLTDADGTVFQIGSWNPDTNRTEGFKAEQMVNRMMNDGTITKGMMDFLQTVWDVYGSHYSNVKTAIRNTYGYDIGFIEAREMVTPWGTYKGGYVPLVRKDISADIASQQVLKHFDKGGPEGWNVNDILPFFTPSMAYNRTGKVNALDLDLTQLNYHLNSVYRTAYMMPAMSEMAKIITHPDFKQAVEARRPGYLTGFVYPWFNRVMSMRYSDVPETPAGKTATRVLALMRRNMRIKAFLGNIASPIKQYVGAIPAVQIIGARDITNATVEVGLNVKNYRDRISEKSPRFRALTEDFHTRSLQALEEFTLNFDKIESFNQSLNRLTYFMISSTQNHVNVITYVAAENYARKKLGLTEESQIDNYAMGVVERSQGTTALSSRPLALSGNEFKRALFDFLGPVLAGHGQVRETAWRNASAPNRLKIAKMATTIGLVAAIPALASYAIGEALKGNVPFGGEEDDDDYASEALAATAKGTVDYIAPFYGNLAISLIQVPSKGVNPLARTVPVVASSVDAAKSLKYAQNEADNFFSSIDSRFGYRPRITTRQFRALMDSITFTTGLPTSTIGKIQKYYEDIFEIIDED